ncbi:DUF1851 domain-containing protein [Asticcacaulis sp. BYS171W]|uniref:DUF1851 domain-containing protein n=1 Tax=Asticcacaulis aquaticus TaxID=2984212 RepID=A0ABT5HYX2_9CAUL|nr:T6SS immunity protein Tdi1 domain-containing protein [Asticcacaulis aquaticus]MDC7685258.1 DUF1851 domain-containing protein [Asticcacaulis aquaticus]
MSLNDTIQSEWGWVGFDIDRVLMLNAFGNVLFLSQDGQYWRICPEDLGCEIVATTEAEYQALLADEEFQLDWEMEKLVEVAVDTWGALPEGYSYCFKIWSPLGGEYAPDNIGMAPTAQVIGAAGNVALQIKDLPDGAEIQVKVVD